MIADTAQSMRSPCCQYDPRLSETSCDSWDAGGRPVTGGGEEDPRQTGRVPLTAAPPLLHIPAGRCSPQAADRSPGCVDSDQGGMAYYMASKASSQRRTDEQEYLQAYEDVLERYKGTGHTGHRARLEDQSWEKGTHLK